ncbi:MAG TPA: tetratricopeptide repeat protein [Bacteroidales bacterium]|nr:tetratricopeptide repeat protein [Bacteroidales bacterium]HPS16957.1 tetratricopeptide repeat protein [Bacteroidales bacterium]
MKKNNQNIKSQKVNNQTTKKTVINPVISVIIAFIVPVLLYLQTVSFNFTSFDDEQLISDNITFLSDFDNAPQVFLKEAFISDKGHFYRPLQTLSYMFDISLSGGNNTWMYHLTNVLLIGFISVLLFLFLRKFLIPIKLALLSTLLFCVHPLFVSSVAWIPARGDLLLGFFSLLSFLFFIEFLQQKKNPYLYLHWASFTIALFCKETAAFLPFLFIIYYFVFSFGKHFEKKYLVNILLYGISGVLWFWLRSVVIGNYSSPKDIVGFPAFVQSIQTIPESLAIFFIPINITAFPVFSFLKTILGLIIIALLILVFIKNKEKSNKEKIFCFAWFLLLILPTMFFKNIQIDYLNHRFFLSHIGILLFMLFAVPEKWFDKGDIKKPWLLIVIIAFLSFMTIIKSRNYHDPLTFYNAATENSESSIAFYNKGNIIKIYKGDLQDAINSYTKAIEIKPDYAEAYNNRGNAYFQQKLYDKAMNDYVKAIELKPDYTEAYYDRGNIYLNQGEYDKAIADYNKTIEIDPGYARAYNNRGYVYSLQKIYVKAIIDYTKAIENKPDYAKAYNNRGDAYYRQGLNDKACTDYKKADELGDKAAKANMEKCCKEK